MGCTCPCCGPKYCCCMALISVWGAFFFAALSIFFAIHAATLVADLPLDLGKLNALNATDMHVYLNDISDAYDVQVKNCLVAVGMYIVTFVVCVGRFWMTKSRLSM